MVVNLIGLMGQERSLMVNDKSKKEDWVKENCLTL